MTTRRNFIAFAPAVICPLLVGRAIAQSGALELISAERNAQILASSDRTAADRTNDLRRRPEAMLVFIGISPGITALDLSAAGGYTTELLARAIGPSGIVYGQSRPRDPNRAPTPPAAPEGNSHPTVPSAAAPVATPAIPAGAPRPSPVALEARDSALRSAGIKAAPITAVILPFENPVPPELAEFDLVTLMFNYHDL